ncbi:hypothetical protein [Paenibacillus pabuli]|uniref:hypothetical protein n=1 Tax=Paenibacillus pabuli TaxID=1472 RepID=UPI0007844D52|nr:hypothetical protein [Paenibacillus pabuli]MEC0125314.1 hypothetical protein [Paenibacillus pabuli]
MNDLSGKPFLKSMMGERIWKLFDTDKAAFQRETIAYFERGYPEWEVKRVKYPHVFLQHRRGH